MLTAEKLRQLAGAADGLANVQEGAGTPAHETQSLRIAAADARAMVDAGSGFGTPETLHVAIVLDNDRATAKRRARIVRAFIARDYADEPTRDDSEARRIVECADALAEYVEELAGFDGFTSHGPGGWTGTSGLRAELPDMAAALARAAFRNVDWVGLARHYVTEERLNPTTEPKR